LFPESKAERLAVLLVSFFTVAVALVLSFFAEVESMALTPFK